MFELLSLLLLNPLSLAALVASALAVSRGIRSFLLADSALYLLTGALLACVPSLPLGIFTTLQAPDPVSTMISRAIGVHCVATGAFSAVSVVVRPSQATFITDRETLLRARLLSHYLLALCMCYAQTHYAEWTLRHAQLIVTHTGLQLAPLAYYTVVLTSSGSTCLNDLDALLYLDALVAFVSGLACYAFPQWLFRAAHIPPELATPSGVNLHLMRVLGALLLGSAFTSYNSIYAPSHAPKRRVLLARLAETCAFAVLALSARAVHVASASLSRRDVPLSLLPSKSAQIPALSVLTVTLYFTLWSVLAFLGLRYVDKQQQQHRAQLVRTEAGDEADLNDAFHDHDFSERAHLTAAAGEHVEREYGDDEYSYGRSRVGAFAPSSSPSPNAQRRALGASDFGERMKSTNPFDVATDMSMALAHRRAARERPYESDEATHVMVSPAEAYTAGSGSVAHKRSTAAAASGRVRASDRS